MKVCYEADCAGCAPAVASSTGVRDRWETMFDARPVAVNAATSNADMLTLSPFARELAHNGGAGQIDTPVLIVPGSTRTRHPERSDILTEIEHLLLTGQPNLAVERFVSALLTVGLSAASNTPLPAAQPSSKATVLTRREREVARLIVAGHTNRCIADELYIAQSTVERHVANILNKLGFNSRTQIAAWAVTAGLASA